MRTQSATVKDKQSSNGGSFKNLFTTWNFAKGKRVPRPWFVLLVELIGTFFLCIWIYLPNSMQFGNEALNPNWAASGTGMEINKVMDNIFSSLFFSAFYVAFGIFLIVIMSIWVSANFNPSVTIYEITRKSDKLYLGTMKISVQISGAILAGFAMYHVSKSSGTWDLTTSAGVYAVTLDSIQPMVVPGFDSANTVMTSSNDSWFWFTSIITEAVLVFFLLGAIFWGNFTKGIRALVIGVAATLIIWVGFHLNNIALNPARLLGGAVVNDIYRSQQGASSENMYLQWTWIYLLGQFIGSLMFGLVEEKRKDVAMSRLLLPARTIPVGVELALKQRNSILSGFAKATVVDSSTLQSDKLSSLRTKVVSTNEIVKKVADSTLVSTEDYQDQELIAKLQAEQDVRIASKKVKDVENLARKMEIKEVIYSEKLEVDLKKSLDLIENIKANIDKNKDTRILDVETSDLVSKSKSADLELKDINETMESMKTTIDIQNLTQSFENVDIEPNKIDSISSTINEDTFNLDVEKNLNVDDNNKIESSKDDDLVEYDFDTVEDFTSINKEVVQEKVEPSDDEFNFDDDAFNFGDTEEQQPTTKVEEVAQEEVESNNNVNDDLTTEENIIDASTIEIESDLDTSNDKEDDSINFDDIDFGSEE